MTFRAMLACTSEWLKSLYIMTLLEQHIALPRFDMVAFDTVVTDMTAHMASLQM